IEPLVETALEELAIPLAKGHPMFERVVREAMRAGYLAARRNAARTQGIYAEDDEADWLMASPAPAASDAPQPAEGPARPVDPRPAKGAAPAAVTPPSPAAPAPAASAAPAAPPPPLRGPGSEGAPSEAALATAVRLLGAEDACA